jgi:hypothetical protein
MQLVAQPPPQPPHHHLRRRWHAAPQTMRSCYLQSP